MRMRENTGLMLRDLDQREEEQRSRGFDQEHVLTELDRITIAHENLLNGSGQFGLDLIEDFHGFDHADHIAFSNRLAHGDEGVRIG